MAIYIGIVIILLSSAVVIYTSGLNSKNKDIIFLSGSFFVLATISSLRSYTVGTDTKNYISIFMKYVYGYNDSHSEIGYSMFNKLISIISDNPNAIIIASSIVVTFGIVLFIYKNSTKPWLSVYLYITMYYYFFSFNYVRQYLALVFIINSWNYLKKEKYLKFALLVSIGTMFHTTALIGFSLIVIYKFRRKLTIIPVIFTGAFLILININRLLDFIFTYFPRYRWYDGAYLNKTGGIMIVILYFCIFIVAWLLKPRNYNEDYNLFLIFSAYSAALSILGNELYIFVRPSLYINIFMIVLIPRIIDRFNYKDRHLLVAILCTVSFLYMLYYFNHNWHDVLPYEVFF